MRFMTIFSLAFSSHCALASSDEPKLPFNYGQLLGQRAAEIQQQAKFKQWAPPAWPKHLRYYEGVFISSTDLYSELFDAHKKVNCEAFVRRFYAPPSATTKALPSGTVGLDWSLGDLAEDSAKKPRYFLVGGTREEFFPFLPKQRCSDKLLLQEIDSEIGLGVFVKDQQSFGKGDYIAAFSGKYRENGADKASDYSRAFTERKFEYLLDYHEGGNLTRFINHSYEPNVEWVLTNGDDEKPPIMEIRALRPIAAGEQLTLDYGNRYWSDRHYRPRGFKGETRIFFDALNVNSVYLNLSSGGTLSGRESNGTVTVIDPILVTSVDEVASFADSEGAWQSTVVKANHADGSFRLFHLMVLRSPSASVPGLWQHVETICCHRQFLLNNTEQKELLKFFILNIMAWQKQSPLPCYTMQKILTEALPGFFYFIPSLGDDFLLSVARHLQRAVIPGELLEVLDDKLRSLERGSPVASLYLDEEEEEEEEDTDMPLLEPLSATSSPVKAKFFRGK